MNIKELREKHRISQTKLSEDTGIPRGRINQWEQRGSTPKKEDYDTLESYFSKLETKYNFVEEEIQAKEEETMYIPFYDTEAQGGTEYTMETLGTLLEILIFRCS